MLVTIEKENVLLLGDLSHYMETNLPRSLARDDLKSAINF